MEIIVRKCKKRKHVEKPLRCSLKSIRKLHFEWESLCGNAKNVKTLKKHTLRHSIIVPPWYADWPPPWYALLAPVRVIGRQGPVKPVRVIERHFKSFFELKFEPYQALCSICFQNENLALWSPISVRKQHLILWRPISVFADGHLALWSPTSVFKWKFRSIKTYARLTWTFSSVEPPLFLFEVKIF